MELLRDLTIPAVIITHDPDDVDAFAGMLVIYERGRAALVRDYPDLRADFATARQCLLHLQEHRPPGRQGCGSTQIGCAEPQGQLRGCDSGGAALILIRSEAVNTHIDLSGKLDKLNRQCMKNKTFLQLSPGGLTVFSAKRYEIYLDMKYPRVGM